nr:hypothetical protein Iba_chr08fCG3360 [Ipomoea batatas]
MLRDQIQSNCKANYKLSPLVEWIHSCTTNYLPSPAHADLHNPSSALQDHAISSQIQQQLITWDGAYPENISLAHSQKANHCLIVDNLMVQRHQKTHLQHHLVQ